MFRISLNRIEEAFRVDLNTPVRKHMKDNQLKRKALLNSFVPKHLAECPREDEIICTWLLRGALHKDHFSKITARPAFIPYFWKPSCFLRLPLLPMHPPTPPPPPPNTLVPSSHFLSHVLLFICWFLFLLIPPPPCVKNTKNKHAADNRASEEEKERLQRWDCSPLCTGSSSAAPKPIHIHQNSANQMLRVDVAKCDVLAAWQGERHWSATGSCIKKQPSNRIQIYKKSRPCMFPWTSYQPCTPWCARHEDERGKPSICSSFLCLWLLDILPAIRFHTLKRTKRAEVRGVHEVERASCLFPPPHRLYFHGGLGASGRRSRLARHDCTFRPNPSLLLLWAAMEMETYWEGEVVLLRCSGESRCIGSV